MSAEVYDWSEVEETVRAFLAGAPREQLDPLLDLCAAPLHRSWKRTRRSPSRAARRRSSAPTTSSPRSCRTVIAEWEQLSIYLNFLIPRLPAPEEDDLSKGILETVSLESYRTQKQETIAILLEDEDATIDPAVVGMTPVQKHSSSSC